MRGDVVETRTGPPVRNRLPLAVVLGLLVLAVVCMHQLSSGHLLLSPVRGPDMHSTTLASTSDHAGKTRHGGREHQPATGTPAHGTGPVLLGADRAMDDGCPGCGDHSVGLASCLLALTLLVLAWAVRGPRLRVQPPSPRRPLRRTPARRPRRVPLLSLAELSVLRT